MIHFRSNAAVYGLLALGVAAGAAAQTVPTPVTGTVMSAPAYSTPRGAVTDHVIVISIDGLRPDAITPNDARVMTRMMREGSFSLTARTITPSKTLPSHTSMLTGVPPSVHGITWNSDRTGSHGTVATATVFGLAKAHGFGTAAFFSKAKLNHLDQPGTIDHAQAPSGISVFSAAETVEQATRYMEFRRPNLLFVHLAEPDAAGHSTGWMSFVYRWAVRRADGAVGRILETADEVYGAGGYTVIITADHGGHGREHGRDTDSDMQIPWIAWGAGVQASGALAQPVNTMDTAATVLWLLGVDEPLALAGRVVEAAYTPAARIAAGNHPHDAPK